MNIAHERLKEILAEAAGKDTPEARATYLDAACEGDADLRRQVERLLAAHDRAGDFLAHSVVPPEVPPVSERPGSVIGRYKLLEEIGEGGFGRVFMAEQTAPVHRKVALKIIKAGMDTREVIARFEAERQALALMDHPNIAHVLDAGATDTGRPYIVMELVRGIPLTAYCDQQRLSTGERLRLFMQVCAAVQHAHQKGIIHRDLKPSNILITLRDGAAVPKVIDFGVAKALGQQLTEKTLFTAFQQMVGTPAYMSPEQAALSGVDVDTRSDIYSLGVLLYELLTGVTPFDPNTLRKAALDEICRVIKETEPPKPSTRLMELARGQRSEVSSQKWKEVHGDLDWIAMKCLEKDRARRYETASNLAQDIERHLHHEPVTAAAPGTSYRVGKFVRRHRFGIAVASALVALLVAGAVVSTWQAVRATRAEKEARTMAAFLEDMLSSLKPEEAKGKDTTLLRQMLDRAAARVDTEPKEQPLIEAGLRRTLGEAYLALGDYSTAEPMFRRALEVRERMLGKENRDTIISVHNLALLLEAKGDYAGAESLYRRTLEVQERTLGKEHPDTLVNINNLAVILQNKGDYPGAEPLFRRALEVSARTLGKEHPNTLVIVNNLARLLQDTGDYAGAKSLFRRALEVTERTLGKEHPDTLATVDNLARLLDVKGDHAGAEPLYRGGLSLRQKQFPDDWRTFASRSLLGGSLLGQQKSAEAEPLLLSGYEGMKQREDQIPASSRPLLKEALQRLVQLYETTDRKDQATAWQRKLAEFEQAEAAKQPVPPSR
jgi:tetratricopeptide (TPR) repeat protein